jgi:ribosomal protein S12 methylthiotransferase accessory factor
MIPAYLAPDIDDRLRSEAEQIARASDPYSERVRPAAETVALLRRDFARFGISRLGRITGLDTIGIPVWFATRPAAYTLAVTQGKGLDDAAAQASAVMEAVEIATAERPSVELREASPSELAARGERFDLLPSLTRRGSVLPPHDEALLWAEGLDLVSGEAIRVPAEAVMLDYRPERPKPRWWQSTDGLASGNLIWEAVLHGLLERIERDASTLWTFCTQAQVKARCLHPEALSDAAVLRLAEQVADAGLHLRLFDITTDIGLPAVFATISPRPDGREAQWRHFDIASGRGCHPSPARAAIRAITEAAQSRLTIIAGARDDFDPELYAAPLKPDLLVYPHAEPIDGLRPSPGVAGDPREMLPVILDRLRGAGVGRVIVVPLSGAHEPMPVVKVLVPELENPPGERRQRLGRRGLAAMLRSA